MKPSGYLLWDAALLNPRNPTHEFKIKVRDLIAFQQAQPHLFTNRQLQGAEGFGDAPFVTRLVRLSLSKPELVGTILASTGYSCRTLLKALASHTDYVRVVFEYDIHQSYYREYIRGERSQSRTHEFVSFFTNFRDFTEFEDRLPFSICDDCGDWEANGCIVEVRSTRQHTENVCRSCKDREYSWCDYLEEYVHNDNFHRAIDSYGDSTTISIYYLENSDDFVWSDSEDCYVHESYRGRVIRGYHSSSNYVPFNSPWTLAQPESERLFFGVELEVECHANVNDSATILHDALLYRSEMLTKKLNPNYSQQFFKFEADGSLSHGWEIITQPAGLDAHRMWWQWTKDKDLISELSSEETSTCGLHVHVNKSSLTPLTIAKIVGFINNPNNKNLITSVARRFNINYARIKSLGTGKTTAGRKNDLKSVYRVVKPTETERNMGFKPRAVAEQSDRYDAVNITNRSTIEFRIFKGTLTYPKVMAAIEFVNAVIQYCRIGSGYGFDLSPESFAKFLSAPSMIKDTQTLRQYIEYSERI
jgi:hypothetical protein